MSQRLITPAGLTALLALACAAMVPLGVVSSTHASRRDGARNVHLVQHSHDDPGWLKTVDQYHYGSNNSIQVAGTAYILDSVVAALECHPHRTFTYAEMAFFMRWWREQDEDMRARVRRLVAAGQLGFVNGGYVQNDEAAAHYVDMIDQTTLGHRFLAETFGREAVPRVGWQIDPFGHSSTQAVLSALYGFDAQFFGRADYQDMECRAPRKEMELLWRGGQSRNASSDLFTVNFPSGNYGPPPGFNWDWGQTDPQFQDDRALNDYNVEERVDVFVTHCDSQFNVTRGNDIMLTMGADFTYANAHPWYKNLDKLIHYVNKNGRLNVFYSSPDAYVKAKHNYDKEWPVKTDDFFPYADCPHCYWTGYFSSRPTAKGFIRAASAHFQSVRQLQAVADFAHCNSSSTTEALWEVVSLAQHHDAITGTAKQHVADDYALRIANGMAQADDVASRAIDKLLAAEGPQHSQDNKGPGNVGKEATWKLCHLSNISVCAPTVEATRDAEGFSVALWNPLGRSRDYYLRIPITTLGSNRLWSIAERGGKGPAVAQVLPVSRSTRRLQDAAVASAQIPDLAAAGDSELALVVQLPPLGLQVLDVQVANESHPSPAMHTRESKAGEALQLIRAGDGAGVHLEGGRITRLQTIEAEVKLDAGILVYNSSDGGDGGVPSGAYIFRPNGSSFMDLEAAHVVKGDVVSEVRSSFHPWVQLTVRTWAGAPHIEVEWTVGPIPFEDGLGREVVVQYGTDLNTGRDFSTDANGREMQARVRDHRPTWKLNATHDGVAANYYPLTTSMEIREEGRAALSVLVDRAQGGASLSSGQMEVMLHRRVLHDDWRGVGEPLNETACGCRDCSCDGLIARGTHLLTLQGPSQAAWQRRRAQQELSNPPLVAFKRHPSSASGRSHVGDDMHTAVGDGGMGGSWGKLPDNVQLLTWQHVAPNKLLLRLAHLYQVGEDSKLSEVAEVDLSALLRSLLRVGRGIESVQEYALSGAVPLAEVYRMKWKRGHRISAASDLTDPRPKKPPTTTADHRTEDPADGAGTFKGGHVHGTYLYAASAEHAQYAPLDSVLAAARVGTVLGSDGSSSSRSAERARQGNAHCSEYACLETLLVQLAPMEIRTWVVHVSKDAASWQKANTLADAVHAEQ